MSPSLSAQSLYQQFGKQFALQWRAGETAAQEAICVELTPDETRPLIAFLNFIRNPLIQVIGPQEMTYLQQLPETERDALEKLFTLPLLIILSDSVEMPEWFVERAEAEKIPVLSTHWLGTTLIRDLRYFLTLHLAQPCTLHGVLLEVLGSGVFIEGDSGIGKSELALELVSRGHRLVADDAPLFSRTGPDVINGKCPEALDGFLEVRGLGVLDIRAMFGESAIKPNKNLKLVIQLIQMEDMNPAEINRLEGLYGEKNILEVPIPSITLPVAPGRNMAVLVEGAVRNHQLMASGYSSSQTFIQRQQEILQRGNS